MLQLEERVIIQNQFMLDQQNYKKKPKTHVNGVVPFQLKKDTNKGQSLFKTLRRTLRSYQSPLKNVRVSLTKKH